MIETVLQQREDPNGSTSEEEGHRDGLQAFLSDPRSEMTFSRRLGLWLAGKQPNNNDPGPSLAKAWAFFEHVTLYRYIVDDQPESRRSKDTKKKMTMAKPGESHHKTKLYPIVATPLNRLGDFGLGFGLYFATLRDLAILTFICGLISIPNIAYFASDKYSGSQEGVPFLLKGSAICTNQTWVPCPTCTEQDFGNSMRGTYEVERYAKTWTAHPSETGSYLNVTDYLIWESKEGADIHLHRTEYGVAHLGQLKNVSIPTEYGIHLQPDTGYILHGENVTETLGYTPLWCGYRSQADCYLPVNQDNNQSVTTDFLSSTTDILLGDSDFSPVRFALKNNCDGATAHQGVINFVVILVMALGLYAIFLRCKRNEAALCEDKLSAADYSIVIKNPPQDAWDPEEWKEFFEGILQMEGGEKAGSHKVCVCTIDVDNENLVHDLVERREILCKLENLLPQGTPLDANSLQQQAHLAKMESSSWMCSSKIPSLVHKLTDIESEIKVFLESGKKPPTTQVFLTFETQAAQRTILSKMSVGFLQTNNKIPCALPKHCLFRGKHVLQIRQAGEPNTIRWQDLNTTQSSVRYRRIATTVATLGSIVVSYVIIRVIYIHNLPFLASTITTIFTCMFPYVATFLMDWEQHYSATSQQAWLFAKVALFNISLASLFLYLITPFEGFIEKQRDSQYGLLPAFYYHFLSYLVLRPAIQISDIFGNIQRFILAPKAKTQDGMNLMMKGTPVYLAERYGNMMLYLYMTLWYCSLYPASFFMGSFAFVSMYFLDRFSLMRSWARSPYVGPDISYFAWHYFIPAAVCLVSVLSAYFWSGFPYDNVCPAENATLPPYYLGDFEIYLKANTVEFLSFDLYSEEAIKTQVSVTAASQVYKYCNQDLLSFPGLSFPALPSWQPEEAKWMTPAQEEIVFGHGWSSLICLVIIVVLILVTTSSNIYDFLSGAYKPRGKDQKVNFSDLPTISGYIPQMSSELSAYPLLICHVGVIDQRLFDWQDPDKPHSHYDVTEDAAKVLQRTACPEVFAKVKQWHKGRCIRRGSGSFSDGEVHLLIDEQPAA